MLLAGYRDEMKEMLDANPGFASRIQFTLEFAGGRPPCEKKL